VANLNPNLGGHVGEAPAEEADVSWRWQGQGCCILPFPSVLLPPHAQHRALEGGPLF
jgi:hypothetical protein